MTDETPKPKRFYETAKAVQMPGGWTVELDGRSIKTPARAALSLPTEKLAKAIARKRNTSTGGSCARMHSSKASTALGV